MTALRKTDRYSERHVVNARKHTTELIRGYVEERKLRLLNDQYSIMLADALALELQCAEFRQSLEK